MLSKIPAKYRKLYYVVVAVLAAGGIVFGVVAPQTFDATVTMAIRILSGLTTLFAEAMALANITPDS